MKNNQLIIQKDVDSLATAMAEGRRVLREVDQPYREGVSTIVAEVILVLAAEILWWLVHDTPFIKSPWFPWIAVAFPIIALGFPLVLIMKRRQRRAKQQQAFTARRHEV